jgi:Niemann-Pick C1 protein
LCRREEAFLNFLEDPGSLGFTFPAINIFRFATRSFGDEFGNAIQSDISLLLIAYMVLLCYVAFNLGKLGNKCVNSRVALSAVVLLTVGLSIAASTGLCSAFGVMYTPLHSVLPFVLLGIGVDDSFVIADAFDGISASTPIPTRTSRALAHAGM